MKNLFLALVILFSSATIAEAQYRRPTGYSYNYSRPSITYGTGYPRNYRLYNAWSTPNYSWLIPQPYYNSYYRYPSYYYYNPYYNGTWMHVSPQFR